jgi:serine/threonine-protein kinase SRPK3
VFIVEVVSSGLLIGICNCQATRDSFDMAPPETKGSPTPAVPAPETTLATEAAPPTPTPPGDESAKTVPDPDPGDIEEGRDEYRPGGFHPVYIGDVYAEKYKVLNKLGYGAYSTVWLVQDLTKS